MRRYRPLRTGPRVQGPTTIVIVGACVIFGLLTLSIGAGLMADLIGGMVDAFNDSINQVSSHEPATVPPSGVALDTPVLDTPPHDGYTNQASVLIQGTVPSATVGKTGYSVRVFRLDKNGAAQQVASVAVGGTTRFITTAITLTEGNNVFQATLVSPSGEGAPSPRMTYILDTAPPKITIISPKEGAKVTTATVDISGTCEAGSTVGIRNQQVPGGGYGSQVVGADGRFKLTMRVVAGPNTIDVMATDQAGNSSSSTLTLKRDYGKLAAHLAVTPSKFASKSQTTLKLTIHATSFNGGPLADAKVTFTVTITGLGPIVSPELTTDATGTATWQVAISGASAGTGQAGVLVTSPDGDQVTETAGIITT